MNKQELIKKYENEWKEHSPFNETASYALMVKSFLDQLKKMDEPQKVTIPQFVADFIAEQKKLGHTLSYSIDACMSDRVAEWYWDNSELFARAWLDGYEVEKEKRYTVKIRGKVKENLLVYGLGINKYFFTRTYDSSKRKGHTRKELEEAGFGWVFSCEGIEIEEVE